MDGWDEELIQGISSDLFPETIISLRINFPRKEELLELCGEGYQYFHLLADYHGRGPDGDFVLDLIRAGAWHVW